MRRSVDDIEKDIREQIAELQVTYNRLKTSIDYALQCFQAALIEGWIDDLAEGNIDNIRDIWQRRIVYAMQELESALTDRCPSHDEVCDSAPEDRSHNFPCECGGYISKNAGGGEWECDTCEFTAEVEDDYPDCPNKTQEDYER